MSQHRTGCVAAVVRMRHNWATSAIEKEYRKFAGEKIRDQDIHYINTVEIATLERVVAAAARKATPFQHSHPVLDRQKALRLTATALFVILLFWTLFSFWR